MPLTSCKARSREEINHLASLQVRAVARDLDLPKFKPWSKARIQDRWWNNASYQEFADSAKSKNPDVEFTEALMDEEFRLAADAAPKPSTRDSTARRGELKKIEGTISKVCPSAEARNSRLQKMADNASVLGKRIAKVLEGRWRGVEGV